jgi:hypothetical protein
MYKKLEIRISNQMRQRNVSNKEHKLKQWKTEDNACVIIWILELSEYLKSFIILQGDASIFQS